MHAGCKVILCACMPVVCFVVKVFYLIILNLITMKAIFITISFCLILFTSCHRGAVPASTPVVNTETKTATGQPMLLGHCSVAELYREPYSKWYNTSFSNYKTDSNTIAQLGSALKGKTIEVFLGTWCGDSQREVPRLVKILQQARFDTANLKLIFVDNTPGKYKQSPQHEEQGLFIFRVPTIVIYGKSEMGRIVESPVVSLEKDLLTILQKQPYTPNYKAGNYWHKEVARKSKPMSDAELQSLAVTMKPMTRAMGEINSLGYLVLYQKDYTQALNIFKLNTFMYPDNAGTYDSLAEGYAVSGDKEKAKYYYQKVLAMKPGDENATKQLGLLNK